MLHKLVVEVVEVRELFEERHKLLLRHLLLDLLTMLEPQRMCIIYQLRQFTHVPQLIESLGQRILEDECAIAVMDQLHKSAVHHFLMQGIPGQQCHLVCIQFLHRLWCQFTADTVVDGLHKHTDEGIHALHRCLLQIRILYNHLFHIDSSYTPVGN